VHYIGTDIIEISRIERAVARWGEDFLRRVYTDLELSLYREKKASLAARFAAKEAVVKALGRPAGISLRQIEVLSGPGGQPVVILHDLAYEQAQKLGLDGFAVSLSHSREQAIAMVHGETV
jgi:holo-[acyl-carrier protein] synthase